MSPTALAVFLKLRRVDQPCFGWIRRSAERDNGRERPRENDGHKHRTPDRKRSRSKEARPEAEHTEDERAKRQKPPENGITLPQEVSRHSNNAKLAARTEL